MGYLLYKMALINRVEINIANNAELHANAQHVLALTYAARPKNTSLTYNLKQKKFKVIPPLLKVLWPAANALFSSRPFINGSSTIIVIPLRRISYFSSLLRRLRAGP